MTSPLHVVRSGTGPVMLLIHGSATDHATWSIQLVSPLRERFALWAYDRRGTGRARAEAAPDGPAIAAEAPSIADHAEDAAALARDSGGPVWVVGSSLGAVVALELMRRAPQLVRGAVLIEPPLASSDAAHAANASFLDEFDRTVARDGGPAAGALFLRTVLGEAAFARMPGSYRDRACSLWRQIRADSAALLAYRPRYQTLGEVAVPTLLLGGARSAAYFRPTLAALAAALPRAQLTIVPAAGHMLHAESPRRFAEALTEFVARVDRAEARVASG